MSVYDDPPGVDWPTGMEMIRQLREALGLFAGAMPVTPRRAWEEALQEAARLRDQMMSRNPGLCDPSGR